MKIFKELKKKITPLSIALFIVLAAYVAFMIALFSWAFLTASKSSREYNGSMMEDYGNVVGFPKKFHFFQNVKGINKAFAGFTLLEMALYTVLYSLGCSVFKVVVTCIVAYLCARYNNWFSRLVYSVVVVTMIIPIVGTQAAEIQMAKDLKIYDHIWGMWLMRSNFLGMYYLVFYSVFKSMPAGYYEAAKIDGANDGQIMCNIALPLVKNTFLSIALILFIEYWNDYLMPNLYLPSFKTLSLALYHQSQGQYMSSDTFEAKPYVMTTVIVITLPVIALFIAFSKRLMGNLSVGGLKG